MVRNEVVSQVLSGMSFSTLSSSDIKKLSVKEITEPKSFDTLGHPNANGLYDPSLGALDRDDMCPTCGLNNVHCPGHLGHIDLLLPVYNPLFFTTLIKILHGTCFHCKKLCKIGLDAHLLKAQIKILDNGFIDGLLKLEDMFRLVTKEQDITNEDIVSQRMAALADEIIKKGGTQDYYVKNIVDQRQKLIKEYIKTKITCSISKCHHCHMPARMLRHEHNCKIFFTKKLTKEKTSKTLMNKNLERKKLVDRITASDWQEGDEIVLDLEDGAINTTLTSEVEVFLSQTYLTPSEARNHLRKVWKTSGDVLKILFGALNEKSNEQCCPVDLFFLDVLSVAPNRFRPLSFMRGEKFENPQTANLAKVVLSVMEAKFILRELKHNQPEGDKGVTADDQSKEILDKITGGTLIEKLQNIWIKMQIAVNVVIDCDLDKLSNDNQPGIRQLLEKKAGLFRKHMMGKRVDYAARSVISPDPYINVDEIGIPEVFAKKLTYPQSVTPWNIEVLRQAVVNGPNVHPGATHVANEDGKLTLLNPNNEVQRKAIANQLLKPNTSTGNFHGHKKVYRHLKNGDFLLLNRQPTLHRPSIQAHKARILPKEKTLRLHYACCKAYNADFDGDEMNAHFPQNEIARAEASQIAAVPYQFLVPKDGTPLAGLIQDHVIAGSHLSLRGRHFNRADYHQLVYSGLSHKRETVKLLPPCIQKPVRLWSGKQVISSVLLNIIPNSKPPITLHGKSKVSGKNWKGRGYIQRYGGTPLIEDDMLESEVIIRDGELLCGLLDKAHYGPTPYGLCHCCYEIYGPEMAGLLLTCLARLFTTFLQLHGFTLGVEDILVKDDANLTRHKVMKDSTACGDTVASKAFAVSPSNHDTIKEKYMAAHFAPRLKRGMLIKELDICMKSATDDFQNQISKVCMPAGLIKQFPQNNLQLMVQSGAKGSSVNCMQISCLLGQIELEGARPPLMISGRSLPSFLPQDTSPRAGGYIDGRFLTGIRPQEYFFHCMAGREGLIDTACKTSSSGYLQRCLIKHLEGITVNYDMTVRDCDGSIYQFYYGEDSLDIPAVQFSNKEQLPFLMDNFGCIVNHGLSNKISKNLDCKSADALTKEINHWKKKHPHHKKGPRKTAFLSFSQKNGHMSKDEMIKLWRSVSDDVKSKQIRKYARCPDTVMSRCRPDRYIGAISESMSDMIKEFIGSNPNKFHPGDIKKGHLSEEQFRTMMYIQNQKSLVQPGQALGLLAAQSIGEPSTQMTLNTFHFAGRGEMNVTLGIPRLREILMVASQNLRTPAIEIPLFPSSHAEKMAEGLRKRFTKVMLSEVIENIDVYEYLCISEGKRYRKYRVRFQFLPYRLYRKKFELNPHIILDFIERKFIKCMIAEIKKKLLAASTTTTLNTAKLVQTKKSVSELPPDDDDNMSDRDEGNDDAAASKMRQKATDDRDYQDDESDSRSNHDDDESDIEDGVSVANTSEGSEFENDSESVSMSNINDTNTMRTKGIENLSDFISCYDYDAKKEEWCEITFQLSPENSKFDLTTLIEALALQTVVYETKGIKQCFLSKSTIPGEEGLIRMKIDGKNIQKMYKYAEILQLNRLYSNNIHAMAETYGIEAAGRVLVKEIRDVFAAYGIGVDYRHLSMIADYMTYEGRYRAFSRTGIDSNSSPLQKMTFETTMSFLKSAILTGMGDPLKSPSARIIAGLPVIGGTGSFELYQRLN